MSATHVKERDPRRMYPQPPFPEQEQEFPGSDEQLDPAADHGERSYEGRDKLAGCATLITGADSGIGRAVALAFAREGADVLISYLNEDADAEKTQRLVEDAGRKALCVAGDLKDQQHCEQLVERAVKEFGRLDVLVNNAAYQLAKPDVDVMSTELFDDVLKTNLYATFYLCRASLPHMKPGGSIINSVSIQGYDPSEQLLSYATSKTALIGFTKALAPIAMQNGVRINAVAPGPVWTPLIPSTMPAEQIKSFGKNTLFQRPAQPAELAPIYVWLASADASYITGEVYSATGGKMPV